MRRIVLVDITVCDTNLGNQIIMEAIETHLRPVLEPAFIVHIPCLERLGEVSRPLLRSADLVFLCGDTPLTSHAWFFRPWRIGWRDARAMRHKVVTVGTGWLRPEGPPDLLTSRLYRHVLSPRFSHSVRDEYAREKLLRLRHNVVNTGCPSLWSVTPEHCRRIPVEKGEYVLTTLTGFRQVPQRDRQTFEVLRRNYSKIYFWPQQPRDFLYAREVLGGDRVEYVDPSLAALDGLLGSGISLDYVGTRLHAYIRAVQYGRRALNIAVDFRALEMGRDFNLTVLTPSARETLESLVRGELVTDIQMPHADIARWMEQFRIPTRDASRQAPRAAADSPVAVP